MEDHTDPTEMDEVKKSEVEEEEEEGGLEQALTEDAFSMLYTGAKERMIQHHADAGILLLGHI